MIHPWSNDYAKAKTEFRNEFAAGKRGDALAAAKDVEWRWFLRGYEVALDQARGSSAPDA